jgi:hypothetical protein
LTGNRPAFRIRWRLSAQMTIVDESQSLSLDVSP